MLNLQKMNLNRYNISTRLGAGLSMIIALMVVLTVTGIWSLSVLNRDLEQISTVNNEKIRLATTMQASVSAIDKAILAMVVANDGSSDAGKQKVSEARTSYSGALAGLEKLERSVKGKELIAGIKENYSIAQSANDRAVEELAAGNIGKASVTVSGSLQISGMLAKACDDMVKYQEELTVAAVKAAKATYVRARYMLLIIGAAMFAFAIFLASFLGRSITRPLSEGVSVAHRIADGDLTVSINTSRTDETGQLLSAMKNMATNLQRIIGEVKMTASNMASASTQLNAGSEVMSKGAGEQASRASQVATASEEMSQTIMDIARNTSSIETSATDTARLANDGEAVVSRSVDKVKSIAKTIGESAQLIRSLGDRSNQIGEIINVINEIADQTNLLALNAAIEAARAGDVGRGFAVVADEVKKLAERAGSSTAEIGGMIKAIQDEVHQVVVSMESITSEVDSGVKLSTQAGDVLRNIVGGVDQLHVMVQQIASATEEMAATAEEINRDIESIASVSKETSGSSEEISRASQELAQLSVNLENVVAGFTL